jgi:hypothetical protein
MTRDVAASTNAAEAIADTCRPARSAPSNGSASPVERAVARQANVEQFDRVG